MPKISVIIPLYNTRPYVERCITSLLQQSFSDFEAIFVDDASTDGCAAVVRQSARNDARIVLKTHDRNKGPGAARNTGIASARASYVTFVDSDDYVTPDLLDCMIRASDKGHYDIVEIGCQAVDHAGNILWDYIPEPMRVEKLGSDPEDIFLIREWGMTQKLWRRSLFQSDTRFPEGLYWEDIAVVPALTVDARNLVKVDFVGYNYLQHPASITNTRSVKHVLDLFRAFDYFKAHLRKRGILDRFGATLARVVKSRAEYFIGHMRANNRTEKSDMLIRLCQMLVEESLKGVPVVKSFTEEEFRAMVAMAQNNATPIGTGSEQGLGYPLDRAAEDHHGA